MKPFIPFLKSIFLFMMFFLFSTSEFIMLNTSDSPPFWARLGAKLEYEGYVDSVYFYNKSMVPKPFLNMSGVNLEGNYSIILLSFEEKMNVHLSLFIENITNSIAFFRIILKIGGYSSMKKVLVDLSTRQVTLPNGTLLGQTIFWIPPCSKGDTIPFVGQENSTVFIEISDLSFKDTIQGVQDVYLIRTKSQKAGVSKPITPTEAQSIEYFFPRFIYYDADTFILIEGKIDEDAFLSAFGILRFGEDFKLVSTNIDLGPQNLFIALLRLLPYIILVAIILITTFYFVFVKKRRSRKP